VATKTADVAGDGTTAATVLADAIFNGGLRFVAAGANADRRPARRRRGRRGRRRGDHRDAPRSVKGKDDLEKVATVSANHDDRDRRAHRRGDRQAWAPTASSTVEEAKTVETTLDVRRGHAVRQGLPLARTS
jgi:chaperonin GroEL